MKRILGKRHNMYQHIFLTSYLRSSWNYENFSDFNQKKVEFLKFRLSRKKGENLPKFFYLRKSRPQVNLLISETQGNAAALSTLLTLRRCDAGSALRRCWRCDAATLQGGHDAATLLTLRRCDAATQDRRCDAVGAATLRRCKAGTTLRRC